MNLIAGKIADRQESLDALKRLKEMISQTLQNRRLSPDTVVRACETLSAALNEDTHLPLLMSSGMCADEARIRLKQAQLLLSAAYLEEKMRRELGPDWNKPVSFTPLGRSTSVTEHAMPTGVLLHIAAGNMEGLPVYTVIGGLMTGNINLLKLPGTDDGVSLELLRMLVEIEPALSEYVYVFDYASEEVHLIRKLVDASDAIVVWGADAAVSAVRRLASPHIRLIEWGNKLSFAYITPGGMYAKNLQGLARHICETNQLLCNSCQMIYLDTEDERQTLSFCRNFLSILEETAKTIPLSLPLELQAQLTLQLKSETLCAPAEGKRVFMGEGASVIYCADDILSPSIMFRNCLVKRLPREELLPRLRLNKGLLQTAGLLCGADERENLTELLFRAGVVRITTGEAMSEGYCGEPHDGERSLQRYIRIVSIHNLSDC